MDAVKFFEEAKRMCDHIGDCEECPLKSENSIACKLSFPTIRIDNPETMVAIVEKWASEHPVKTRQSEFLKMFPSPAYCDSYIDICPQQVQRNYTPEEGCEKTTCHECEKAYWLAEVD